jgi:hypothetical protein
LLFYTIQNSPDFATLFTEGQSMTVDEAVALALEE